MTSGVHYAQEIGAQERCFAPNSHLNENQPSSSLANHGATVFGSSFAARLHSHRTACGYYLNGNPDDPRIKTKEIELRNPSGTFAFLDVKDDDLWD